MGTSQSLAARPVSKCGAYPTLSVTLTQAKMDPSIQYHDSDLRHAKARDVGSADVPQAIDNVGTRSVVCGYQGTHQPNKGGHA